MAKVDSLAVVMVHGLTFSRSKMREEAGCMHALLHKQGDNCNTGMTVTSTGRQQ